MNTMDDPNHYEQDDDELFDGNFFPMDDDLDEDDSMDGDRDEEEEVARYLSNLMDSVATERNIYITVNKSNAPDNQSLYSSPIFYFVFYVIHRTSSDTDSTIEAQLICAGEPFQHPFHVFASPNEAKAEVASMLSDLEMPFSIDRERGQSLLWKELIAADDSSAGERVPLQGFDNVVTKITESAVCIVSEASASGRGVVEMVITIDKRTVVPHEEFDRLSSHFVRLSGVLDHDDPELFFESSSDMFDDVSSSNGDQPELNRAIEQSFLAEASGLVPAAKSAMETLERFKYEGTSSEDETCVICKEEVMIGSQLTRMPCSHLFHGDCILQWLHRSNTCPLCRYKLRTH